MKIKVLTTVFLVVLLLTACFHTEPYYHYEQIKNHKWNKEKWLVYQLDSLSIDPAQSYDILLGVVNSNQYLYQNLWLRISQNFNDTLFVNDTIEVKLADENGKWMGSGTTGLYQLTVPYKKDIRLDSTRKYSMHIRQIMKDDPLKGIDKIGVIIRRSGE